MLKRIIEQNTQERSLSNQHWLNAEALAEVEVTSEDAAYPIESGLLSETAAGWRAAQPGPDQSQRPAVLGRERFAVVLVCEQNVILIELRERQVGGEILRGADDRETRRGLRHRPSQHFPECDAFPEIVVTAPAGDAMDVGDDLHARQLLELLPAPTLGLFHESIDAQFPRAEIGARDRAVVQHRPFFGLDLPRREPGLAAGALDLIGSAGILVHLNLRGPGEVPRSMRLRCSRRVRDRPMQGAMVPHRARPVRNGGAPGGTLPAGGSRVLPREAGPEARPSPARPGQKSVLRLAKNERPGSSSEPSAWRYSRLAGVPPAATGRR